MADKVTPADYRFRADFDAFWPNYDHAPETCFRFVQRGLADADLAARMCRHRRVAVQAGAHAGFWPRRLGTMFRKVYAFEPEPILFECARLNLKRWRVENVDLRPDALGAAIGDAQLQGHRSAGGWFISEPDLLTGDPAMAQRPFDFKNPLPVDGATDQRVAVKVTTIDALNLAACDAIYLDVEGYETPALEGAAKTIAAYRPLIHVEELPASQASIRAHLNLLRYVRVATAHKDCIYRPEERA